MEKQEIIDLIKSFIHIINHDRNPYTSEEKHRNTPIHIHRRWKNWGLDAELIEFPHFNFMGRNIFVPPADPSKPAILLLAHHDTVPNCPGIDDNGSGMTVVDILAYAHSQGKLGKNVCFAMVDFEENDPRIWAVFEEWSKITGMRWADLTDMDQPTYFKYKNFIHKHLNNISSFTGARHLLSMLNERTIKMDVVLNFETVGYTAEMQSFPKEMPINVDKGDFVALIGNNLAEYWIENMMKVGRSGFYVPLVVPMAGKAIPDTRRSDHSVFWDAHHAAIMFTDTANFRNPNYHLETDTEIDFEFMAELIADLIKLLG